MASPPPLDVTAIRAQIPAVGESIYLNSGWQGPCPLPAIRAVQEAFEAESQGATAPPQNERRLETVRRARRGLAALIGAEPAELSLQQSTTEGINIVLAGLGLKPGDEVITCNLEHPSVIVPAYYARDRRGIRLKIVALSAGDSAADIVAKFERAASDALKLMVVSHIAYGSGQLLPVRELSRLARDRGGYLLVDAAQSVGQIPLDVRQLECDFLALPGHKWLLGPAGTGALFVRRDLIERLEPPKVGPYAAQSYSFQGDFRPASDRIQKLELTPSSVPLLAGLNAALEFVQEIGLTAVHERALSLARYATRRLASVPGIAFSSPAEPDMVASGLVSFSLPQVSPEVLTACLWEEGHVVARTVVDAACTRICLHVFNTEQEVDVVEGLLQEVARAGPPRRAFPTAQLEAEAMTEL